MNDAWRKLLLFWLIAIGPAGCFPPAIKGGTTDGDDGDAESETTEVGETSEDTADLSDTQPDSLAGDTNLPPETTPDTDTTDDADTTPDTEDPGDTAVTVCEKDDDCDHLSNLPCAVGRCQDTRCVAVFASVPCDDDNWCTIEDQCSAGVCVGRPFTASESMNWIVRLGGTGDITVIDHVVHPSGESTLVGAFEGELEVPGRTSLVSAGGIDVFLLRFHPSGAVVQAFAWGQADHETPTHVTVHNEDVVVTWGTRPLDFATEPTFHWTRVSRHHTSLVGSDPFYGTPLGIDVTTDGVLLVIAQIKAETAIPGTNGGTTVLSPANGVDAYVGAFTGPSARWVQPVTGLEIEAPHHVLALQDFHFGVITLEPGAKIAGTTIVPTTATTNQVWSIDFGMETGAMGERGQLGLDWEYAFWASRFERTMTAFVTSKRMEGESVIGLHVGTNPMSPSCQPTVTLQSNDTFYSTAVPTEAGGVLALYATSGLAVNVGGGVSLQEGPHTLALTAYSPRCEPHRVVPLGLTLGEAHPVAVHRTGVALGASSKLRGARGGRVYLSGPLRGVTTPGPMFAGSVLVPTNEFEAYFGSIGPQDLLGCQVRPR